MTWTNTGTWAIPDTAVHELEHDGRRWRVTVALPPIPPADALTLVVYVLDPYGTLGTAVQVARITHLLSQGALPALIVVGVGPASDDLAELNQQRMLDLTPSIPDPAPVPPADAARMFGRGDVFLRLPVDVIAPYVESTHRGDPQDRTIAGGRWAGCSARTPCSPGRRTFAATC